MKHLKNSIVKKILLLKITADLLIPIEKRAGPNGRQSVLPKYGSAGGLSDLFSVRNIRPNAMVDKA